MDVRAIGVETSLSLSFQIDVSQMLTSIHLPAFIYKIHINRPTCTCYCCCCRCSWYCEQHRLLTVGKMEQKANDTGRFCRFYLSRHSMKIVINIGYASCMKKNIYDSNQQYTIAEPPRVMKINLACGAFCVISNRATNVRTTKRPNISSQNTFHLILMLSDKWYLSIEHIMLSAYIRSQIHLRVYVLCVSVQCVVARTTHLVSALGQYRSICLVPTAFTLISVPKSNP